MRTKIWGWRANSYSAESPEGLSGRAICVWQVPLILYFACTIARNLHQSETTDNMAHATRTLEQVFVLKHFLASSAHWYDWLCVNSVRASSVRGEGVSWVIGRLRIQASKRASRNCHGLGLSFKSGTAETPLEKSSLLEHNLAKSGLRWHCALWSRGRLAQDRAF